METKRSSRATREQETVERRRVFFGDLHARQVQFLMHNAPNNGGQEEAEDFLPTFNEAFPELEVDLKDMLKILSRIRERRRRERAKKDRDSQRAQNRKILAQLPRHALSARDIPPRF